MPHESVNNENHQLPFRIQALLASAKINQRQLADYLGITRPEIIHALHGKPISDSALSLLETLERETAGKSPHRKIAGRAKATPTTGASTMRIEILPSPSDAVQPLDQPCTSAPLRPAAILSRIRPSKKTPGRLREYIATQRPHLEHYIREHELSAAHLAARAQSILLYLDGVHSQDIARITGQSPNAVLRVRRRFAAWGLAGLVEPEPIIRTRTNDRPPGAPHRSPKMA